MGRSGQGGGGVGGGAGAGAREATWRVLLIGGVSGTGKSMVARELGLRLGLPWLHLDDFRLAFQHSRAVLPRGNEELYLFWDVPGSGNCRPSVCGLG